MDRAPMVSGGHRFKIKAAHNLLGAELTMDDQELRRVQSVSIELGCSEVAAVTVRFLASEIDCEIDELMALGVGVQRDEDPQPPGVQLGQ